MLSEIKNVYFSGISSVGMSGIAKILAKEGYNVFGSDIERKGYYRFTGKMGIKSI